MRFFTVMDFQHLALALFLGLAAALAIYLSFRYGVNRWSGRKEESCEEDADEASTGRNPTPPVLLFVYAGFLLWLIFYILLYAVNGGSM
jgi:hypothetical protein